MNLDNERAARFVSKMMLLSDNATIKFVGPPEWGYPEFEFDYKMSHLRSVIDEALSEWIAGS